jgi:hypothetical protein
MGFETKPTFYGIERGIAAIGTSEFPIGLRKIPAADGDHPALNPTNRQIRRQRPPRRPPRTAAS